MLNRLQSTIFLTFLILTLASRAARAQPACDAAFFDQPDGATSISRAELNVICGRGAAAYDNAFNACSEEQKRECLKARADVCQAMTSKRIDTVARCYRATEPSQTTPSPDEQIRGEMAGAGAVSIVAQGTADFLMTRAEQEVSLYAATELQKAVCRDYGEAYFSRTCALLDESEDEVLPIGLGVLRRAIVEDLRELPKNVLNEVFERLTRPQKEYACSLDVGYALAIGLWEQHAVTALFQPDPQNAAHILLRRHAQLAEKPPCGAVWTQIEAAAKQAQTGAEWNTLHGALAAYAKAPTVQFRHRVILSAVAVLKQLRGVKFDPALDEAAELAVAIVEEDWVGFVSAAASADKLGPILLCKQAETSCKLDGKARAALRLIVDVTSAQSSDGVSSALERFAAPLGSWRRKYEGWSFMLQGYVGAKYAYESVDGDVQPGTVLSPVLAVGLEVARPLWSNARLGLFFQAIDIGNVSSVRLNSEDDDDLARVEVAPDITAVQLLAPGAFLTFAPWKAPFAISLGAEWVPELRSLVDGERRGAFHVGGALVVDTPILEIAHD